MLRERRENTGAENLGERTEEDNVYTCVFRMCVNSCTYVCLYVLGAVCVVGSCVWCEVGFMHREIGYMSMVRRLCVLRAICCGLFLVCGRGLACIRGCMCGVYVVGG